ncbi:MAG TPA: ABC transporter ATP-binding protein [Candidatus Didemnitutus sp.]|nr:ABC transporter ATP-binding protein [Candidatus Didemnitutus sp.]
MSEPVIAVENLGKRYSVNRQRTQIGLRHVLEDAVRRPLHWLQTRGAQKKSQGEDFWALSGVSFEVKKGEVIGIIGRNGAGKSTLLKILSRITEPTKGRVQIDGRVASLLEVGTGFHAELTGRENIFLNGAILGMSREEIRKKFDEIVAFSEVEKFLDMPVKRYSSGMYVRLAFAVAAHLEPEILIVDEVLAVGDAGFQKKCLGKMRDTAADGRTVLFVSHDLAAIEKLCSRAILLESGRSVADGAVRDTLARYQSTVVESASRDLTNRSDRRGSGQVKFTRIQLLDEHLVEQDVFLSGQTVRIRLHYKSESPGPLNNCRISVSFHGWGKVYFIASTELCIDTALSLPAEGFIDCIVEKMPLSLGTYYLNPFFESNSVVHDWIEGAVPLRVEDGNFYGTGKDYPRGWEGKTVLVKHQWSLPPRNGSSP